MRHQERMNPSQFVQMIHFGYQELNAKKEEVNALNVFPVPDGDTGTNMYLSFGSGIREVDKLPEDAELAKVVEALALGLLMGARGNSGVILSQLFRGFQLAFAGMEDITPESFAQALHVGVQTAYKAVVRPVEGTILTVAKEAAAGAKKALKTPHATIADVLFAAVTAGETALRKTIDMLPALRQAGVVDSGGQGLIHIYKGFMRTWAQDEYDSRDIYAPEPQRAAASYAGAEIHGEGEYGYCTEFFVQIANTDGLDQAAIEEELREQLLSIGESLLVVSSAGIIKVHVHTLHPGLALEAATQYGSLQKIKIDNMTVQHQALTTPLLKEGIQETAEIQPCGIVVVAVGDGLIDIFHSLFVDAVVSGGQTMNPSTEEILQAVEKVHARDVFILPNNSNVFMAAEQVAQVTKGRAHVIATTSIGAGFAAALAFQKSASVSENKKAMQEAAAKIHSGAVTASIRETMMGEHDIRQGDYIGLLDGEIRYVDTHRTFVLEQMLDNFCSQGAEICTVFYAHEQLASEVDSVLRQIQLRYADVEFETRFGGQPVYDYLLAAE